jgi:hypothetical protein
MSDYVILSPFVAPGPVTEVHTAPRAAIGLEVDAVDRAPGTDNVGAARFVYARGSNMASNGQFCHLINGSAVLLASANSGSKYPIGACVGALSATNLYGWVAVQGRVDFMRGTNTAPSSGVPYYFNGTAGQVATNVGVGSQIQGIVGVPGQTNTVVSSAGSYKYDLNRPFCLGLMTATNAGGY